MASKIIHKLSKVSTWYFILAAVVVSEILTLIFSTIVSKILWGHVSDEVLIIGFIDAFIVCFIIVLVTVYLIKEITQLTLINEQLQKEISQRRRAEEALQKAHDELEIRVSDRTRELKRSNEELQQFAHIASHDLQEPLRKVKAFGDRLKEKCGDSLSDQGLDYLGRMQHAAVRMQTLINGLLQFSRVTTKAHPFVSVDLGTITQEVLSDLEVRIEQTGGKVEVGELPTIDADPLQMRQLLQNLISNALKFSKKDRPPIVKVASTLIHNDGYGAETPLFGKKVYEITVEDNGVGFDQKYTDRIFGVFQRLHGRNEYEGTGIGLSVCKKIAERHGGSVTARSEPGEGATFAVILPAKHCNEEIDNEIKKASMD